MFARLLIAATLMQCQIAVAQDSATLHVLILDESSGESLPGTHVFLNLTTKGASADSNGAATIRNISLGSYEVVATAIGYEMSVEPLVLDKPREYNVTINLKPEIYELGQVEVVDDIPRQWKQQLKRFKQLFIGQSGRARRTQISNEEVLDFYEEDKGLLFTASSTSPLQIENRALGYRIVYYLEHFAARADTLEYYGRTFFEELEPKNARERRRWDAERERAYLGSMMHFVRALAKEKEREEGFWVYHDQYSVEQVFLKKDWKSPGRDRFERPRGYKPYKEKMLFSGRHDWEREIFFEEQLFIVYLPDSPSQQVSWMEIKKSPAYIEVLGRIVDPLAIRITGSLSHNRMAELLPWDYVYR